MTNATATTTTVCDCCERAVPTEPVYVYASSDKREVVRNWCDWCAAGRCDCWRYGRGRAL